MDWGNNGLLDEKKHWNWTRKEVAIFIVDGKRLSDNLIDKTCVFLTTNTITKCTSDWDDLINLTRLSSHLYFSWCMFSQREVDCINRIRAFENYWKYLIFKIKIFKKHAVTLFSFSTLWNIITICARSMLIYYETQYILNDKSGK